MGALGDGRAEGRRDNDPDVRDFRKSAETLSEIPDIAK